MKRLLTTLTLTGAALIVTATPALGVQVPGPILPGKPPAAVEQGPPNYPAYSPAYEVASDSNSLDTTSIALGALGGIAFAGAGLGITLGVQRRRDHAVA